MQNFTRLMSRQLFSVLAITLLTYGSMAQTLSETQMQNARATGYAIVAARNPGQSFSIYMVKWDGVNTLEHNANNQINPGWHAQAAIKGNYFTQSFDGSNFNIYSSVVTSQAEFDQFKSSGTEWWIVCSTLEPFATTLHTLDGKVGIGTRNPEYSLHLKAEAPVIKLASTGFEPFSALRGNNDTWLFGYGGTAGSEDISMGTQDGTGSRTLTLAAGGSPRMKILNNGNIGIGTLTPNATGFGIAKRVLSVWGTAENQEGVVEIGVPSATASNVLGRVAFVNGTGGYYNSSVYGFRDGADNSAGIGFHTYSNASWVTPMTIKANGKVGIGTAQPDELLTVKGKIHAQEVRVDLDVPGPDYVFEKNYDLKSLEEVETYINTNKHLPEIPSAKTMEKEGISMGEMQMKLLQKIEELTLYLIEQQKQNKLQQQEIIALQAEIKQLKK
jgi:hypothetical protein